MACYDLHMITIKDIARIAGVSQGTVSNALNGRGNVSAEKMKLVQETAKSLGYVMNAQAKQLRRSSNHSQTIAMVLPNIVEKKFSALFGSISEVCEQKGYSLNLFVTGDSTYVENKLLGEISAMRTAGVVSISSCANIEGSYLPLINNGVQVVFALRDPHFDADYITFDYERAGYEIMKRALDMGAKSIGIFDTLSASSPVYEADLGHNRALKEANRNVPIVTIRSSLSGALKSAMGFFNARVQPDVIICASEEYAFELERAAYIYGVAKRPTAIVLSHYTLPPTEFDFPAYTLNYQRFGARTAAMLIERIERSHRDESMEHKRVMVEPAGFISLGFPGRIKEGSSIKALLMRGHAANALINMTERFTRETNIDVDYTVLSPNDIYDRCMSKEGLEAFDVVRASVSVLPILPRQSIVPFKREDHKRITEGMFGKLIDTHSMVHGEPLAMPFDIGSQIMVYRKDFFGDPILKRTYFEQHSRPLEVPADFDEYNSVAKFFSRNENPASPVPYGSTVGFGTDSEMYLSYILRYRGLYEKYRTSATEHPVFDFNVTMEVFKNFLELCSCCCIINDNTYYGTAHDNFVRGNSAIEVIAFNYASNVPEISKSAADSQIGYTSIPSGYPTIGGGSLVITSASKRYDAALKFVEWACGADFAETLTYLGGMSPHESVYQSGEVLSLYPWYRLFPETIAMTSDRSLWDAYHVRKLERLIASTMRSVAATTLSPYDASMAIANGLQECKLK